MLFLIASAGVVFLLDQATKHVIETRIAHREVRLGAFVRLRHVAVARPRYAGSLSRSVMILVWLGAFVAAALLSEIGGPRYTFAAIIAMGAMLGGAAGNLFDVLQSRAVRDFIAVGWWPVFNVADVAIIGGCVMMLIQR